MIVARELFAKHGTLTSGINDLPATTAPNPPLPNPPVIKVVATLWVGTKTKNADPKAGAH